MSENMRNMNAIIRGCLSVGKLRPWSRPVSDPEPASSDVDGNPGLNGKIAPESSWNKLIPNAITAVSELSPNGLGPHMGSDFFHLRRLLADNSPEFNETQIRVKSAEFMIKALAIVHESAKTAEPKKRRKAAVHELIRFFGNSVALLASVFLLLFSLDHMPSGILPDNSQIMYILPCLIIFGASVAILADRGLGRMFRNSSLFHDAEIMSRALHESELVTEQLRILLDEGINDERLDDLIQRGEEICGLAVQSIPSNRIFDNH